MMMNYEKKYYDVNGIHLHVVEAGNPEGDILLLLHGFPEFWYGWRKQIAFFAKKGFRVIVPDQRGYNLSSKPAAIEAYRLKHLTNDIVDLIRHFPGKAVYLVGHDWGGAVAWSVAIRYPELLKKLVVINLPHPQVMKESPGRWPKQILKSWYIGFFQLPFLPETCCRLFNYRLLERSMRQAALPGTFKPEEMEAYRAAWKHPGALRAMINWYRAIRYGNPGMQQDVLVPTLLIWGKQDRALSHEMARPSIEKCRQGRLEMIEEATHWVQHEKPDLVNRLIAEFIPD